LDRIVDGSKEMKRIEDEQHIKQEYGRKALEGRIRVRDLENQKNEEDE